MEEYIERAAVLSYPIRKDHCDKKHANEYFIFGIESVMEYVENLPAADVVEVVRCRECKRWGPDPDSYGKDDGPKGKCMKSFEETYDDDFCSYGQRKEDAHVRDN